MGVELDVDLAETEVNPVEANGMIHIRNTMTLYLGTIIFLNAFDSSHLCRDNRFTMLPR